MDIMHPVWLQVEMGQQVLYGYNQGWYRTSFQRTRGCGPTAAAMLLVYLSRRVPGTLPYKTGNLAEITDVLEQVWSFVTPGWLLGLNSTGKFCEGIRKLLARYRLAWQCRSLSIRACKEKRASLREVAVFLEAAMAADCPVAFLNLHKGKIAKMESWHWMVIVGLQYEPGRNRYMITCYDNGRCLAVDLGLWLQSTRFGGGFVYIEVPGMA